MKSTDIAIIGVVGIIAMVGYYVVTHNAAVGKTTTVTKDAPEKDNSVGWVVDLVALFNKPKKSPPVTASQLASNVQTTSDRVQLDNYLADGTMVA